MDRFFKQINITSREAYEYYRQNRKEVAKAVNQYNYYVKAINGICALLREIIIEEEEGIFISGIGYFGNVYYKDRLIRRENKFKKKYYKKVHKPNFFPEHKFQMFSMSDNFTKSLTKAIYSSKTEYKLRFDLIDDMEVKKTGYKYIRSLEV